MRGLSALTGRLQRQARELQEQALRARDESARDAMERARGYAPVKTGTLRHSIQSGEGRVYTRCPYAASVEFGSARTAPKPFLSRAADGAAYMKTARDRAREAIG